MVKGKINGSTSTKNGTPVSVPGDLIAKLESNMTTGYVPQLPINSLFTNNDVMPFFWLRRDIEAMLWHSSVRRALNFFKGGITGAEFWGGQNPENPDDEKGMPICPDNPQVGYFVKNMCERFWDQGVPKLQQGYEYGWIGAESIYETKREVREWKKLEVFSPNDTYLLTENFVPVGIRVKNVKEKPFVDLWSADGSIPAKGLWYAHMPRYNRYYGQSQLLGAWRAWRRLASKDAAETVIDGAFYRFCYRGPIGRFPAEDLQGPNPGASNTTLDADGNPRRYARDIMRQICEQSKAGASIVLPSKRDKDGNYLYDLDWPTTTLSGINAILDYPAYLEDQITEGIGVPKELLEASETGSGYSGRRIPLEAFLDTQQQLADAFLTLFVDQVLKPLVLWNFGEVSWTVKVKRLIETKAKSMDNGSQPDQARSEAAKRAWETRRMQQGGGNPQQPPQPAQPTQQPTTQPQAALSTVNVLATDKHREIARRALGRVRNGD